MKSEIKYLFMFLKTVHILCSFLYRLVFSNQFEALWYIRVVSSLCYVLQMWLFWPCRDFWSWSTWINIFLLKITFVSLLGRPSQSFSILKISFILFLFPFFPFTYISLIHLEFVEGVIYASQFFSQMAT